MEYFQLLIEHTIEKEKTLFSPSLFDFLLHLIKKYN